MITYLYADQLISNEKLAAGMFGDRAYQFKERLGWDVTVDANGYERDQYDAMNPMYIISVDDEGRHQGSMRVMPTVGQTMVNDHFRDLTGGAAIEDPLIWETTRFCLAPGVGRKARRVAGEIMLAGCQLGLEFGLKHSIGVFDARMERIYRGIGWQPMVIGSRGTGREQICAGLWAFSEANKADIAASAGIDPADAKIWFDGAFGPAAQLSRAAA